jgi:nitronate monooxygenase
MRTRLTQAFGIEHPIILAPAAGAAGGALASAVTRAGGFGMIGGGYGDAEWLAGELAPADAPVGAGFITWSLEKAPHLLDQALAAPRRAIMPSFGDPAPVAAQIHDAKVPLICQIQTLDHARAAIDADADVIVAQGGDAGGHGDLRGTMSLAPEIADPLTARGPATILCAAGGIADGRGLAAALMLGADGAVVGSRFWVSAEARVPKPMQAAAINAAGDDALRTRVVERAREPAWPGRFTIPVLRSSFTDRWHGDQAGLDAALATERPRWQAAAAAGDPSVANPIVGEAAGLIHDAPHAADILSDMIAGAEAALARAARKEKCRCSPRS